MTLTFKLQDAELCSINFMEDHPGGTDSPPDCPIYFLYKMRIGIIIDYSLIMLVIVALIIALYFLV